MEMRQLRYFVAVAEERNFTRAAERLFIAQPPLSRQIQQLEEDLGVQLFERGTRPLSLTEAGQFFYAHARDMLARAAEVKSMTQRVGHLERTLTMGFIATTLYGLLPTIIRRYRQRNPHIELVLHEMTTVEQNQALKEGRIDVGFGRLTLDDPMIRRIVLRKEVLMLAVPQNHPIGLAGIPVRLQDIVHERLIIFPAQPRPSFADQVLAAFNQVAGRADIALAADPLPVDRLEWEHIQRVLAENEGNISATARALKMHRRTLQRKLAKRPVKE